MTDNWRMLSNAQIARLPMLLVAVGICPSCDAVNGEGWADSDEPCPDCGYDWHNDDQASRAAIAEAGEQDDGS